jgi:hypothetical protein
MVRVTCPCGTPRHNEPEALARLVARSVTLARVSARKSASCSVDGRRTHKPGKTPPGIRRQRPPGEEAIRRRSRAADSCRTALQRLRRLP